MAPLGPLTPTALTHFCVAAYRLALRDPDAVPPDDLVHQCEQVVTAQNSEHARALVVALGRRPG